MGKLCTGMKTTRIASRGLVPALEDIMDDNLTVAEDAILDMIVDYTRATRDTAEGVTGWGGPRPNSGRPATGRKKKTYYVTDTEADLMTQYLTSLRK